MREKSGRQFLAGMPGKCERRIFGFWRSGHLGSAGKKIKTKSYLAFDSINYPVAAFIDNQRMIRYTSLVAGEEKLRFFHACSQCVPVEADTGNESGYPGLYWRTVSSGSN